MTRADWLRLQERRRGAASWGLGLALYAAAFGAALIVQGGRIEELADTVGPVMVRLGSPEGSDSPLASSIGVLPQAAAPKAVQPAQPAPAQPAAQKAEAPKGAALSAPPKEAAAKPDAAAKSGAAPAPKPEAAAAAPAAAAPTAQPAATPTASPGQASGSAAAAEAGPVIAKGSEAGNSYSATVGGASGQIARSMYIPIYRFMPPPMYVEDRVVNAMVLGPGSRSPMSTEERRRIFLASYVREGDIWRLKAPVELPKREALWTVLEEAGYVVARADYKSGKVLSPVVLVFTVKPGVGYGNPVLTDVKITQSSGYSDIDEAVLYGFRQAVFSSSAKAEVSGKFTYRFDR